MILEVWYSHGPVTVWTVTELDAFVAKVLRETADHPVPPMLQVAVAGHPERGVLEAGIGPNRGFLNHLSADGGITLGDPDRAGLVTYDYLGNATEVAAPPN